MTKPKHFFSAQCAVLLVVLVAALPASAETQTPPPPLPFDPLALELVLPHDNVNFNLFGIRGLSSTPKNIGGLSYQWAGQTKTVDQYLGESGTDSFLVLDEGKIAYEKYFDINNVFTQHQSWSMAKSINSALIGIAISEGKITSINDPVTKYMPELAANAYNGVSIKHLLQMASGVKFDETYLEFNTNDVNWLIADPALDFLTAGVLGKTLKEFVSQPSFTQERTPGTQFDYSSMDSQVLGMVLQRAVGMSPAKYLEQKVWRPMGAGWGAYMLADREGTDFSFGNNYATTRDYARFGEMFRNNGKVGTTQVVPASWVYDSTHSTEPWLNGPTGGYAYQWWTVNNAGGAFMANGFEGQNIYVSPSTKTTIVKLSDDFNAGPRSPESQLVFKTISDWAATH